MTVKELCEYCANHSCLTCDHLNECETFMYDHNQFMFPSEYVKFINIDWYDEIEVNMTKLKKRGRKV